MFEFQMECVDLKSNMGNKNLNSFFQIIAYAENVSASPLRGRGCVNSISVTGSTTRRRLHYTEADCI